jgi:flagella basal body P-ring formation protein FlgA
VEGEQVLARDLAAAEPAFAALPPETPFGYAPAPGARRAFHAEELRRRAKPHELSLAPGATVCVVRPLEPLTRERLLTSMRASLSELEARIEVVDLARTGVPRGELQFPPGGLSRPPAADPGRPVLWKGYVLYGQRRRFPVWAKVRVAAEAVRAVALRDLKAGELVEAGDLQVRSAEAFPFGEPVAMSIEQAAGKILRGPVAAGSSIPLRLLQTPPEVRRGDQVRVRASSGGATIQITARAETAGSTGDTVVVLNPASGKRFRARVEGLGIVSVRNAMGDER